MTGSFVDKLVVVKGSFAEQYAIENKVKYEVIENDPKNLFEIIFNALG